MPREFWLDENLCFIVPVNSLLSYWLSRAIALKTRFPSHYLRLIKLVNRSPSVRDLQAFPGVLLKCRSHNCMKKMLSQPTQEKDGSHDDDSWCGVGLNPFLKMSPSIICRSLKGSFCSGLIAITAAEVTMASTWLTLFPGWQSMGEFESGAKFTVCPGWSMRWFSCGDIDITAKGGALRDEEFNLQ